MPSVPRSRGRLVSLPLTRQAGILAAAAVLVILVGCMSISIGKFSGTGSCTEAEGVFCQEGEVTLPADAVREVFYPVPYAHQPNLEVSDTFNHGELLEQKEGSFRVRNQSSFAVTLSWKARGVKALVPVAVPPEAVLPPPAPVPASGPPPAQPTESSNKAG